MSEIVKYKDMNDNDLELSKDIIKKYLVPSDSKVTDQEINFFLKLCQHQQLNPFVKEVYLIKYGTSPATMVTGKETFLKRATRAKNYAGHKAWTEGSVPNLIGKAEVYVTGYQVPVSIEVDYDEYVGKKYDGSINSMWSTKPKTMLRKVALMQALREAFPDTLGGLYDSSEINTISEELEDKPIIKVTEKEIEKKVVEAEFFPKTEKTTEIEVKVINTPEPEPEKDAFDEIKEKVLTKSVMIDEIKRISSLLKLTDTLLYDNDIYVDKWLKPAITNLYNELVKMENEELQKSRTISTEQLLDIKHLREEQNIEPGDFLEEWSKKLGNNLTSKSFLQISQFEANKIIDDMTFNPKN